MADGPGKCTRMISPSEQTVGEQEQRLLAAVGQGDGSAFWALWEQHRNYLSQLCLRAMHGNRADAEDALSQAMMKAWDRLPAHAGEVGNPRAWLGQLTRNLCTDLHRERQRTHRLMSRLEVVAESAHAAPGRPEVPLEGSASTPNPRSNWRPLIAGLPVRLRQPFLLRFVRGWPYERIALRLALSTGNVRKRIQQARALLREGHERLVAEVEAPQRAKWEEPARATGAARQRKRPEIIAHTSATHFVRVRLASGVEKDFHLFLEKRPGRHCQKIKTWRAYVHRHPGGWKKRLELADLLYEAGDWGEAVGGYVHVLRQRPWETRASLRLGNIWRLVEDWREASEVYERAMVRVRQPSARRHLEGLMALCAHDFSRAAADFREAARLEPENAAHWHGLAEASIKAGRPGESLQAIDQALQMNPGDLVALSAGHAALIAAGKLDEAWQRVERVLELAPNDILALKRLADHRCELGLIKGEPGKQTKSLIRRGLQQAPHAAGLHGSLAAWFIGRGQWRRGLAVLRNYVRQHPNSPIGWCQLAHRLSRRGQSRGAAEALEKALRLELPGRGGRGAIEVHGLQ
jgi:RNA polymerase sigma factor (sigma-70 family)